MELNEIKKTLEGEKIVRFHYSNGHLIGTSMHVREILRCESKECFLLITGTDTSSEIFIWFTDDMMKSLLEGVNVPDSDQKEISYRFIPSLSGHNSFNVFYEDACLVDFVIVKLNELLEGKRIRLSDFDLRDLDMDFIKVRRQKRLFAMDVMNCAEPGKNLTYYFNFFDICRLAEYGEMERTFNEVTSAYNPQTFRVVGKEEEAQNEE